MLENAQETTVVTTPPSPAPAPTPRPKRWIIVAVVVAALALTLGATTLAVGNVKASHAESRLRRARLELAGRNDARTKADTALVAAQKRLADARDAGNEVAKTARVALPTATEIVTIDSQRIDLRNSERDALTRNDSTTYNRNVDTLNAINDRNNALLRQLRSVLPS